MMACSLVHGGKINNKLARIEIIQDSYEHYPDDIDVYQCRQGVFPECFAVQWRKMLVMDSSTVAIRRLSKCPRCGESTFIVTDLCDKCLQRSYERELKRLIRLENALHR